MAVVEAVIELTVPLVHLWQSGDGFRAPAARSLMVAASRAGYLVFVDGDCV